MALGIGLTSLTFGFEALANGGTRDGIPAFPFFLFGLIGLQASAGDLRARTPPLSGLAGGGARPAIRSRVRSRPSPIGLALPCAASHHYLDPLGDVPSE